MGSHASTHVKHDSKVQLPITLPTKMDFVFNAYLNFDNIPHERSATPSTNLNFPKGFKNGKQKSRFLSSKYNKIKAAKSRSTMQESNLSFGVYKEISLCKYIINQQKL